VACALNRRCVLAYDDTTIDRMVRETLMIEVAQ
jgi:hypothetical protein